MIIAVASLEVVLPLVAGALIGNISGQRWGPRKRRSQALLAFTVLSLCAVVTAKAILQAKDEGHGAEELVRRASLAGVDYTFLVQPSRQVRQGAAQGPEQVAVAELEFAAYLYAARDYATCLSRLKRAERFARTPEVLNDLAVAHLKLGQVEGAQQLFEAALAFAPAHASINRNYGLFLIRKGELDVGQHRFLGAVAKSSEVDR